MKSKKTARSAAAVVLALALALSGTFAWQSISQQAVNEAQKTVNPGGRLHDDFSGYNDPLKKLEGRTKDIYVENFGSQAIYARIRLDEYMEIGDDANLMDTTDPNYATRNANSLVAGAKKEDVKTWTTHLPDQDTPETDLKPQDNPFHKYWTWTMGGQDPANPDGQTVYMPTFNQNKDSLQADINGSWENERNIGGTFSAVAGGVGTVDKKGEPFADYTEWTEDATADGGYDKKVGAGYTVGDVLTLDDYKVPGEIVDADTNDAEEDPVGALGNSGTENTNWKAVTTDAAGNPVQHTARKTETGSVISMRDWLALTDAEKNAIQAWVYDEDGWAYWSQPIEPGTATGLLLDSIELTNNPYMNWYYAINAVGQFITKDDMGRKDNTGFYDPDGGENPSDNALTLLDYIGVNTSGVEGTVTATAKFTDEAGEAHMMKYVVPGMQRIELNSTIGAPGKTPDQTAVAWSVTGARSADTRIVAGTDADAGKWFLNVGADEPVDSVLLLTAASTETDLAGLNGKLRLSVEEKSYSVRLSIDGGARSVLPGSDHTITASLVSNDFASGLPQTFNFELVTREPALDGGTALTNASGTAAATLHTSYGETGRVTVKATPTDAAYSAASGELTLNVTDVEFEMDLMDGASYITGSTVSMRPGEEKTFSIDLWSDPKLGIVPASAWTWESSDTAVATVDGSGKVTVVDADGTGATAVISAKLTDKPELRAEFTVASKKPVEISYRGANVVDTTKEIMIGETMTFGATYPTGYSLAWSSSNSAVASVDSTGVVTVPNSAAPNTTATITATATSPTRATETVSASFTVKATNTVEIGGKSIEVSQYKDTVSIDGIDWYVCAVDEELHPTDGSTHRAALLLSQDIIEQRQFHSTEGVRSYVGSDMETWLNGEFLTSHTTIQSKALEVTLKADNAQKNAYLQTNNKVFLLSYGDIFGGNDAECPLPAEETYAYNGARLPNIDKIQKANFNGNPAVWWTRSVGRNVSGSMMTVWDNGGYDFGRGLTTRTYGVRPAFWYDLDA